MMRFTSIDPLEEKYYSISPYAYCANNPVRFIDPNGEEIKIYYDDDEGKPRSWTFNGKNQKDAPDNQFIQNFMQAYDYNVKNGGRDVLQAAAKAEDYVIGVEETDGHSGQTTHYPNGSKKQETLVKWNSNEGVEAITGTLSPATILEHEMDHAVQYETNTAQSIKDYRKLDDKYKNKEEERVIKGSEYKTGRANREIKKGEYRSHRGNKFIKVNNPISNKKVNK